MKFKILVVDDEYEMREVLSVFLRHEGYRVITASNGKIALNKVKINRPDIVILDINMPKMDGIECLKRIKELDPNISVIMVTVVTDEDIAKKTLELGAYDYITKPLGYDYLKEVLLTKLILAQA